MTSNPKLNAPALAHVDGWPIHLPDLETAIAQIVEKARAREGFTVFTMNLDHVFKLRRNRAFRDAYARADLITADGEPVAWLSRFQRADIKRTTGADMFVPLSVEAAAAGLPVYIFGSSLGVLQKSAAALRDASGGRIEIAGLRSPSLDFDPTGAEADAAIEAIRASRARICFVALSPPKNEIFSARAVEKGCKAGFVCVGAAVDFVAGTQVRAPQLWQRVGMEWAWRLVHNPQRLAKRYADCARVLFDLAVVTPLVGSLAGREI